MTFTLMSSSPMVSSSKFLTKFTCSVSVVPVLFTTMSSYINFFFQRWCLLVDYFLLCARICIFGTFLGSFLFFVCLQLCFFGSFFDDGRFVVYM